MGGFVRGDVVIVPFPFTDLSGNKKRPAFVLADLQGDDIIVCQITSKAKSDSLPSLFILLPAH
jgi:mRNA interferase MazF